MPLRCFACKACGCSKDVEYRKISETKSRCMCIDCWNKYLSLGSINVNLVTKDQKNEENKDEIIKV